MTYYPKTAAFRGRYNPVKKMAIISIDNGHNHKGKWPLSKVIMAIISLANRRGEWPFDALRDETGGSVRGRLPSVRPAIRATASRL